MTDWAKPPQSRQQLVLFSRQLDDAIGSDHPVRLLDEILSRIDWSPWEATYQRRGGQRGQPAIHPRVLASVILFGLMKRVRSSRALEEALEDRLAFRWLAEGRSIDHTTLSEFRRKHGKSLRDLFVQVGLIARELGLLPLETLAFDGSAKRANNRRRGTRTPKQLRAMRKELAAQFEALRARQEAEEAREEKHLIDTGPSDSTSPLPDELADTQRRLAQVDAALAELARIEAQGQTPPQRLPITDPQSRLTPNKDGGFAPNYTPLATVDVDSGLIVAADVIAGTDEAAALLEQVDQVQEDFELESPPGELLGDGMMPTGANLQGLEQRGVTLYSPAKTQDPQKNPALRKDPSQPVPAERIVHLPVLKTKDRGRTISQFSKDAFVFDKQKDCYWCPNGKALTPRQTTSEMKATGRQKRVRYKANVEDCAACSYKDKCIKPRTERRQVSRYEHDPLVEKLNQRMASDQGQAKYKHRAPTAERPFAMIKEHMGARRFLLRGLEKVKTEWHWLTTAFNLKRLMSLLQPRAGPTRAGPASPGTRLAPHAPATP